LLVVEFVGQDRFERVGNRIDVIDPIDKSVWCFKKILLLSRKRSPEDFGSQKFVTRAKFNVPSKPNIIAEQLRLCNHVSCIDNEQIQGNSTEPDRIINSGRQSCKHSIQCSDRYRRDVDE
jgi:hypothetical protein